MARQLTARLAQSTPRLLRRPLRPLKAAAEAGAKAEPHGQSQSEARTLRVAHACSYGKPPARVGKIS